MNMHESSNATPMLRQRLCWLDILKGIGIIFVMIGHIYSNSFAWEWIYSFHMPLFFFAGGWLYRNKSIRVDIRRRVSSIIVPYFVFGAVILLYWALFERHFRESSKGIAESVIGLFIAQYDYMDFNVHLWFLPCFFLTAVIYNVLATYLGKRPTLLLSLGASLVFSLYSLSHLPWSMNRLLELIGYYALGNALAEAKVDEMIHKQKRSLLLVLFAVITGISLGIVYFGVNEGIVELVSAIIGIMAIMIVSILINKNAVLQYLGRISLVILCIHGPVYRVVIKVISVICGLSTEVIRENFIFVVVIVAITGGICCLAYEIINRIAPWMIGKQMESKSNS